MNKSKIIATLILAATFLSSFYFIYIVDEGVTNIGHIFLFLLTVAGFFVGFGIGTNEPFDKKKEQPGYTGNQDQHQHRQAA